LLFPLREFGMIEAVAVRITASDEEKRWSKGTASSELASAFLNEGAEGRETRAGAKH